MKVSASSAPTGNAIIAIRPKLAQPGAGKATFEAEYHGDWYPATVVEENKAAHKVKIHYKNWHKRHDEWLPKSSERLHGDPDSADAPKQQHKEQEQQEQEQEQEEQEQEEQEEQEQDEEQDEDDGDDVDEDAAGAVGEAEEEAEKAEEAEQQTEQTEPKEPPRKRVQKAPARLVPSLSAASAWTDSLVAFKVADQVTPWRPMRSHSAALRTPALTPPMHIEIELQRRHIVLQWCRAP